jgi:hypothetical protein
MYTTRAPAHRNKSRQAVSAGREPRYERPSYANILPEEFFDTRIKLATVGPEAALMYAVLEDAFLCFQKQFEMERWRIQRGRQAEEWFFSDDFRWLFSFVSVCDVLGLQPQFIRMKLRRWSQSHLDTLERRRNVLKECANRQGLSPEK